MTEPVTILLDGYKIAHAAHPFRKPSAAARRIWRLRIGPYILTLTKRD